MVFFLNGNNLQLLMHGIAGLTQQKHEEVIVGLRPKALHEISDGSVVSRVTPIYDGDVEELCRDVYLFLVLSIIAVVALVVLFFAASF